MPSLLFILSLLFSSLAYPQAIISVPDDNEILFLTTDIEVLIDKQGTLSLDEIMHGDYTFIPTTLPFSGGYTKNTHWFRFNLQRDENSSRDWILNAGPGYLDSVRLYSPSSSDDATYDMIQAGDHTAASTRPTALQYGLNSFQITLADELPHTFYLRLQTHSTSALNLKLATVGALTQFNNQGNVIEGLKLGIYILLTLHPLIMWLWLRKSTYLLVVGYILGAISLNISINGFVAQSLFPESLVLIDVLAPIGSGMQIIFLTLFFIFFYNTKHSFPKLHNLFVFVTLFSIVTMASIAFDQFVVLKPYLLMTVLLIILCFLYVTWRAMALKQLGSQVIFWGFMFYTLMVYANILAASGVIPAAPILLELPQIGSIIFMIFIQVGLYQQVTSSKKLQQDTEVRAVIAENKSLVEKQRREDQSSFMTMVTHEFRTPLAEIDSAIQMLNLSPSVDTSASERYHQIQLSVTHLNNLLENALIAERSSNELLQPQIELLSLRSFITTLMQRIMFNDRMYHIDISADLKATVSPRLFDIAVSNLVVNALKYSPDESDIYVQVVPHTQESHSGTLVTVTNNYHSLTKPDVSKWFDKYYRDANPSNINGFGLGLYLVNKIVTAHNGNTSCSVIPMDGHWQVAVKLWFPALPPSNDTGTL